MIERRDGEMGDITYVIYDEDGDVCWVPEDALSNKRDAKHVAETLDKLWAKRKKLEVCDGGQ